MPRNMSFTLTTKQVRDRTKTVTRRLGWWYLKPGEIVNACVKCMGLKKSEKVERICQIRIISVSRIPLYNITPEDVVREGFPGYTPEQFVSAFTEHYGIKDNHLVNRIEFEYVED